MSKLSNRQLSEGILNQLEAGKSVADVTTGLAALLIQERRTKDADAVVRNLTSLLQSKNGHVELEVTTVHELQAGLADTIKALFASEGKDIVINHKKDSSVIGGVLVESPGKRLDLTVRRRLQRLVTNDKELGV